MNFSCETIINENEKLKLTDLEKSCLNIFDYLKLHFYESLQVGTVLPNNLVRFL